MKYLSRSHSNLLVFAAAISFAVPAIAVRYTCGGAVRGVAVDVRSGELLAESIGSVQWPRLCSFRSAVNGIPPDDCKRTHAALLAAQLSGRTATFWVDHPTSTCASLLPWEFVEGFYFLRVDG